VRRRPRSWRRGSSAASRRDAIDERGRQLQDELASLSAIAGGSLSLLRAHAIEPDDEDGRLQQEDAGMDVIKGVFVQKSPPPPPAAKELEYTADLGCATTTKAMMAVVEEQRVVVVHGAVDLHARVEALEADRAATLREIASMRAEPARVVLRREMARRLCRDAVAAERPGCVATVHKQRFSVPAICKVQFFFDPVCKVQFAANILLVLAEHSMQKRLLR
jgi:hypothetical protein